MDYFWFGIICNHHLCVFKGITINTHIRRRMLEIVNWSTFQYLLSTFMTRSNILVLPLYLRSKSIIHKCEYHVIVYRFASVSS